MFSAFSTLDRWGEGKGCINTCLVPSCWLETVARDSGCAGKEGTGRNI